jgi:hypothetical protein
MLSNLELFILFFLAPVFLLISAYLLAKNKQKIPRTSSFFAGLFFSVLGVFALFYTYNLFTLDQATFPLKYSPLFNKADHPLGFIICTILDFGIGLALLGGGVRAMFRSISNKNFHVENDLHP